MRFLLSTVLVVASVYAAPVFPGGKLTVDMLTKSIDFHLKTNKTDIPPEIRSLMANLDDTDKQQLVDLINGFADSQIDPPKTLDQFIQLLIQKVPKVGAVVQQMSDKQAAEISALNNADVTAFNNEWKDAFFAVSDRNVTVWLRNAIVLAPKYLTAVQQLAANEPAWKALCTLPEMAKHCADYAENKDKLNGFIQLLKTVPADYEMQPDSMMKLFGGAKMAAMAAVTAATITN